MLRKFALLAAAAFAMSAGAASSHEGPHPTDAQIAHIAYTAGQIDVVAGKQALERSRNPAVRSFAEQMIRDHAAVNEQAVALVTKLGVTPEANGTSTALSTQAEREQRRLATLDGAAFDRAYIENEIAFHRTVNRALGTVLIPGAHNPDLKSLLETGLTLFQEHQKHAEQIAGAMR